jgi:hypothetical protein
MVFGDDGPAVGHGADRCFAGVDHRLDGEHHAGLESDAGIWATVVKDLRLFVEFRADAVPTKLADHRIARLLRMLLDGMPDVTEVGARPDLCDAQPEAFESDLAESARLHRRLADLEHAAAVAVVTVADYGDVEIDDVAVLELTVAGNAMTYLMVDRGADRLRIRSVAGWSIVERRRDAALNIHDIVVTELVDLASSDSRPDMRRDVVEDLGRQAAGNTHFLDFLGGFFTDAHAFRSPAGGGGGKDKGSGELRQFATW